MRERADIARHAELRSILAHFGLIGDVALQEAATLSGGEKTKLSLARLVGGTANVLLLDEPTNNLDPRPGRPCWPPSSTSRAR